MELTLTLSTHQWSWSWYLSRAPYCSAGIVFICGRMAVNSCCANLAQLQMAASLIGEAGTSG